MFIGDQNVGKTSLAMELIKPQADPNCCVRIINQNYDTLKVFLYDDLINRYKKTDFDPNNVYHTRSLHIEVTLPARRRTLTLDWIDTPGEIWSKSWQQNNPQKWLNIMATVQQSQGIILVLSPYREMPGLINYTHPNEFISQSEWLERFQGWVDFFRTDCQQAKHILICLNKADLFCSHLTLDNEVNQLAYKQGFLQNWSDKNDHVLRTYFHLLKPQIAAISSLNYRPRVLCFITSMYNRYLLELPWIYLAGHLS